MADTPATLIFSDPRWRRSYRDISNDMNQAMALVFGHEKCSDASLNILFTDNKEIQALNKEFRKKDWPTNVLSFPSGEEGFLGDIAISYDVISEENDQQSKTWRSHTLHMVVHGALHLLGYDHEDDDDAEEMEALEIKLLKQLGVANPY